MKQLQNVVDFVNDEDLLDDVVDFVGDEESIDDVVESLECCDFWDFVK